jgi:predicted DNA-binding protein (MmcQ/YjbR family)
MTRDELRSFCASLPHATHVVQWGNSDVYKVGGKVFALMGTGNIDTTVSFKVSHLAYEILSDSPGLRPAPYLASRGMKWIQHYDHPALTNDSLRDHVKASYDLIVAKLTRKLRAELGL